MQTDGVRHTVVTPDNHGPIIQIVTWFAMVVMILATALRLAVRYLTSHIPGMDDAIVVGSMLVNVGGVIAISLAVTHGLGRRESKLTEAQVSRAGQDVFASSIMYILAISLAKLSTLSFIERVVPANKYRGVIKGSLIFLLAWTVISIIVYGLQCGVSAPWDPRSTAKCFNIVAFWSAATGIDVFTDLCLIVVPGWILWDLQMNKIQKRIVFGVFSSRGVVIAASILRATYLKDIDGSGDIMFDSVPYHVATQCHAMLNTIITCLPGFKPFMDRANTGLLSISFKSRLAGGVYDNTFTEYAMTSLRRVVHPRGIGASSQRQLKSVKGSIQNKLGGTQRSFRPDEYSQHADAFSDSRILTESRSQIEEEGPDKLIIRYTTDWTVHVQDEHRSNSDAASR
ncbi:hypothetical protein H112_05061 [Trichophyton rubrum D6]|uniref:Rhodopsin domain-containing protein n=5 Tax=Trichophyton TaxID=5550 RepID=A0A178ENR6_TRIRU|nr:hypothetical protein H100_05084 [Trichophyton rubrum MR850]EZF41058.1 hypothetical protein H102_05070 [Trichophyton rubrum CBS 100081]EZF51564.1 hypothetical protein H103_05072 [Trichophyton rubrum CBS 288.86]EZF72808.1 hypothetical protein H105_05091 [Trichophyton soudanense CBS 452.61]EZF83524.1 hypothetical protein H110_05071 [Trichophyton rubrum MR1448]EZG15866.1 hypothetical protein H107_05202 [Trichophyton rubrum CBS 202.88]KDB32833.1 hypothetical protein H112_05061 [Trichophyton rub